MKLKGFTLAEVLISLTIIGIIAAMVIPSLMADINEKAFDAQRKVLYARMSQAIAQMKKIDGYGTYSETTDSATGQTTITDTVAEAFISDGLSKVYKITDICGPGKISACGISSKILNSAGVSVTMPTTFSGMSEGSVVTKPTKAAAFTTKNGESIAVYYNPYCDMQPQDTSDIYARGKLCIDFIYDLNGIKAPNRFGKDIGFISVFYKDDPIVVAPMPLETDAGSAPSYSSSADIKTATELCNAQDINSRLPDREELMAIRYHQGINLVANMNGHYVPYWSSSIISYGESGYAFCSSSGYGSYWVTTCKRNESKTVRCVKK